MKDVISRQEFLRSGELARMASLSTDTLRHYERKGLLARPRRSANGYREYPASALDRVRLVRRALEIGFTLNELAQIFSIRDRGGAPCREVRAIAGAKLLEVERRIEELAALREELLSLLKDWDARLAEALPTERASLLESLHERFPKKRNRPSPLRRMPNNSRMKVRN